MSIVQDNKLFCSNCGKQIDKQAVVCIYCGSLPHGARKFCTRCGTPTNPNAAVCLACGAAIQGGSGSSAGPTGLPNAKPGKVQTLAIATLVSGCLNAVWSLMGLLYVVAIGIGTFGVGCLFIVFPAYLGVVAVFEIIYATQILPTPMKINSPSKVVPILEIICVVGCNPVALAAGILNLVFSNDPDVKAYFAANSPNG